MSPWSHLRRPRPVLDLRLYLVLDPELCGGLEGMVRVTRGALAGGATLVQLRAPDWKKRRFLEAAQAILPLCRAAEVPFIVNDHVDVALAVGAEGVHVGQDDLPPTEARRLMGPGALVGLSIVAYPELAAVEALEPGTVDYLGVGPIFPTGTKPDAAPAIGVEGLRAIVHGTPLPTVAIGGIGLGNASSVYATGTQGVAVVSAICTARDPKLAATHFRDLVP